MAWYKPHSGSKSRRFNEDDDEYDDSSYEESLLKFQKEKAVKIKNKLLSEDEYKEYILTYEFDSEMFTGVCSCCGYDRDPYGGDDNEHYECDKYTYYECTEQGLSEKKEVLKESKLPDDVVDMLMKY